eukprot:UN13109
MIQLFVVRYTKMQDKDEEKQTLLAEDEFCRLEKKRRNDCKLLKELTTVQKNI